MVKWKRLERNEILTGDGFYISYNPKPCFDSNFIKSDGGQAETALCIRRSGKNHWLILNGDFRREYEAAFLIGLGACLSVWTKYKETHASTWSSTTDISKFLEERIKNLNK